jgi:TIR domain
MPEAKRPLKLFLCHAHSDAPAVRALYNRLVKDGVDAWLDKEKLLPGQDWELEIRKAVRESDVVVVCLSKEFNKSGFRQKEVRLVLDTAMEKPEGEIFIIPARLEECDTLESLRRWQWVDLFEADGYERFVRALQKQSSGIDADLSHDAEPFISEKKSLKFTKDGSNDNQAKRVDVGGNVSDSMIFIGDGNVINMNAHPILLQQKKTRDELPADENTFREIKTLIEFGLYNDAYKKCIFPLSQGDDNALINLLAGIAYTLAKGENKLSDDDIHIIDKHISLAIHDSELRSTALAVLGCIKYGYYYLNKLYDSSRLTLEFIKEELRKDPTRIDKELLNLITPTEYALVFLEIL